VWEDDENKRGGKWIIRLKKGVIDRYWDDMLLAVVVTNLQKPEKKFVEWLSAFGVGKMC